MPTLKDWVEAARPRTLPLALASIGMGAFLAASVEQFRWEVLVLTVLTTIFLQVLSNFANDYGDSIHGADSNDREGPQRAVQSGAISPAAMRRAMSLFALLSFVSGVTLLLISIQWNIQVLVVFLGLGLLAIAAAITYTSGKKPYGYAGLGDISVLIFFGLVGVLGSFYLHTAFFDPLTILPALSCGLLSVAVLNVNNIRDIKTDALAGKKSIPVRLGRSRAVIYHWLLLSVGITCSVVFVLLSYNTAYQWIFLLSVPLLIKNGIAVQTKKQAVELDPYLKQLALSTLIYVLTFGIGHLL
ncbi:1,4-dihydroxy-2-naphthoate polyprenyltransferase [Tunicatimonas pelagia]|uniref:1,4-dihydroxy-2-naphthoate polyprenyltransferase n=1 Tax=Tunicatimonas pelagia TaxID=931531 RepID=UPI0026650F04|nr:1,4-dihydroxy-2-naphthoate polyprenyltransferase [Tunicatimonas pelagia]WKN41625.1 1,4-dihydroxy-2-naphthoate polyprenyltransferase [Tunicatimonas pelagia]